MSLTAGAGTRHMSLLLRVHQRYNFMKISWPLLRLVSSLFLIHSNAWFLSSASFSFLGLLLITVFIILWLVLHLLVIGFWITNLLSPFPSLIEWVSCWLALHISISFTCFWTSHFYLFFHLCCYCYLPLMGLVFCLATSLVFSKFMRLFLLEGHSFGRL